MCSRNRSSVSYQGGGYSIATLLLQQGTHPALVQHLLGHASVSLTLDRYSHWTPSMGDATAAAMDAALGL
jgi:integrase